MPSKHHRPATLQRRSTSESNAKLTLGGLNLQKLDAGSNLQLQVALNNATKGLPKGKGKKSSNVCCDSTFQFFPSNPKTRPCILSQQPPSRTTSDQQIRSSSKLHLRELTQTQRTTPGATRLNSSQRPDSPTTTKSSKKSGFTLASPLVVAHNVEGEGDSDEWVSSESLPVTPQNQSSDSESGDEDDDVVSPHLNLTGAAHFATSPDDREPPTPTIPQPPTPVNNVKVKEQQRHRLPTAAAASNEAADINAADHRLDRYNKERFAVSAADDQESVDPSDHHARPEEGLASTPRPRAIVDRDSETPSRHLLPAPLSNPPAGPDPTARESSITNPRLGGGLQDRPQQPILSIHTVPRSHPHISRDSTIDNDTQGRDQTTMTQVSEDLPLGMITKLTRV